LSLQEAERSSKVERIGHRGAPREFAENSLQAFRRAFERGADAVELDVHATSDGEVVVHHDPTVGRGANSYAGSAIAELALAQLRAVRLADGVGIPTLAQVLGIVPAGRRVYVEIKGEGIEELVAAVIKNSAVECAVHSFDHATIARIRQLAPEIPRGILYDHRAIDIEAAMWDTGARDVWPNWKLIDRETVDRVHARGGRVVAWTVNSAAAAGDLAAIGVDGVCTDDVRLLDSPAGGWQ
jgi:glycerophosphoryl diester phosphodiesterase